MPKRKQPELKPAEQFKRFREAAKRAEVDETGKTAEEAFRKLSTSKPKTSHKATSPRETDGSRS